MEQSYSDIILTEQCIDALKQRKGTWLLECVINNTNNPLLCVHQAQVLRDYLTDRLNKENGELS